MLKLFILERGSSGKGQRERIPSRCLAHCGAQCWGLIPQHRYRDLNQNQESISQMHEPPRCPISRDVKMIDIKAHHGFSSPPPFPSAPHCGPSNSLVPSIFPRTLSSQLWSFPFALFVLLSSLEEQVQKHLGARCVLLCAVFPPS